MYSYHTSPTRTDRLTKTHDCRCESDDTGLVVDIVDVIEGGKVRDPSNAGDLLTSEPAPRTRDEAEGRPRRFIYGVARNYKVRIALDTDRKIAGAIKHETLLHNQDLRAAGEIGFTDGIITSINDHSGSYHTDNELENNSDFVKALLRALDKASVEISSVLRQLLEDKQ